MKSERSSITEINRHQLDNAHNEEETAVQRAWNAQDTAAANNAKQVLSFYSASDSLTKALIKANRKNPLKCRVYLSDALYPLAADVVVEEKREKGMYIVTLKARDTGEVLHKVTVSETSTTQAINSMEVWINSTDWQ